MSQKTTHGYHFTLEPNRSEKGAEKLSHIQTQTHGNYHIPQSQHQTLIWLLVWNSPLCSVHRPWTLRKIPNPNCIQNTETTIRQNKQTKIRENQTQSKQTQHDTRIDFGTENENPRNGKQKRENFWCGERALEHDKLCGRGLGERERVALFRVSLRSVCRVSHSEK